MTFNEVNEKLTETSSFKDFIYRWIDEYSNKLVIVCNEEGKMIFTSSALNLSLGFTSEELTGIKWFGLLCKDDVKYIEDLTIKRNMNWNEAPINLNIRNKFDEYILFQCNIEKLYSEENENYFYFITLNDLYKQLASKDLLTNSNKITIDDQLAAGIAHEIRNPLTSIKGFLQLMNSGVSDKEAYYKIMTEEIDKLEAITSELLFISKPLTREVKPENVNSMIEDIIILLISQAKLKGISINNNKSGNLWINCDRSQMKQVLLNLVKNAIEAMDDEGTITITSRAANNFVEIDIIDEGKGIPEEVLHKVNEPFFTTKQDGTGLGLMISKRIIEAHEGELRIIPNECKGCTFRISIPLL